ncbi:MAG: hypothetical protein IJ637_04320 [Prevotella sp.]|nr:hypothetical protein [Prevotella sp.]
MVTDTVTDVVTDGVADVVMDVTAGRVGYFFGLFMLISGGGKIFSVLADTQ